jgi:hypothetical protein
MGSIMAQKQDSFTANLPTTGAALDFIKIMAAVLMVVDHWDDIVLDRAANHLMLIGRAVFPLFCYATATAILRAGEEKAVSYAAKILVLAIFVEPVSQLARGYDMANVLFTLGLGAAFIPFLIQRSHRMRMLIFVIGLATVFLPSQWEFGILGVLLPGAMYLVLKGDLRYIPWLILVLAFVNFNDIEMFLNVMSPTVLAMMVMIASSTIFLPWFIILFAKSLTSTKRLTPKYFLHIFYPLHMILLALIKPFV